MADVVKVRISAGESLLRLAPWSEVNMHMRIAGRPAIFRLRADGMADVLSSEGKTVCAPITAGEAGFYQDETGFYVLSDEVLG